MRTRKLGLALPSAFLPLAGAALITFTTFQ